MMEILAAVVTFFLTGPLQTELNEKLAAARAPQAVATHLASCAGKAAPAMIEKALSNPVWAVNSVLGVWTGYARPEAILLDAAPACRPAIEAARPFLTDAAGS